jgi:hypothetical protein
MKDEFRKKYLNANIAKFNCEVTFAKDGTVSEKNIYFIIDEFTSYDITSDTFRYNPEWNKFLHWTDGWRSVLPDMIFRPNRDINNNNRFYYPSLDKKYNGFTFKKYLHIVHC